MTGNTDNELPTKWKRKLRSDSARSAISTCPRHDGPSFVRLSENLGKVSWVTSAARQAFCVDFHYNGQRLPGKQYLGPLPQLRLGRARYSVILDRCPRCLGIRTHGLARCTFWSSVGSLDCSRDIGTARGNFRSKSRIPTPLVSDTPSLRPTLY